MTCKHTFDKAEYCLGLRVKPESTETLLCRFNRKPKLGLAFLHEKKILGESAEEIAFFFLTDERLDKTVVGEFLGDPDVFNKQV